MSVKTHLFSTNLEDACLINLMQATYFQNRKGRKQTGLAQSSLQG